MEKRYFNYFKFKSFVAVLLAIALFVTAIPSLGKDARAEEEPNQKETGEELDPVEVETEEEETEEESEAEEAEETESEGSEADKESSKDGFLKNVDEDTSLLENMTMSLPEDDILDFTMENGPVVQPAAGTVSLSAAAPTFAYHGTLWREHSSVPTEDTPVMNGMHYVRENYEDDNVIIVTIFVVNVNTDEGDTVVVVKDAADGCTLVYGLSSLGLGSYAELPSISELDGTEYQDAYDKLFGRNEFRRPISENDGYFIVPKGVKLSSQLQVYIFYGEDRPIPFWEKDSSNSNGDTREVYAITGYVSGSNASGPSSSSTGDFSFSCLPEPQVLLDQEADETEDLNIGDTIRMSVTVDNPSSIWLENTVVDIYNAYDDTDDKRLNGAISNVSITVNDPATQTILDTSVLTDTKTLTVAQWQETPVQSTDEDGQFLIGGWGGSNMVNSGIGNNSSSKIPVIDVPDDASITIEFDYILHKDDVAADGEIPIRAEINATSPERAFDAMRYGYGYSFTYKYVNEISKPANPSGYDWTIEELSDEGLTVLNLADPDVTLDKTVSASIANVGDTITYTVTASNADDAGRWIDGVLIDELEDKVQYVAGSLKIDGSIVSDDTLYVSGSTITIPDIVLEGGESTSFSFQVKILRAAAGTTVKNFSVGTGANSWGIEDNPENSPEVQTKINPLPDVTLDKKVSKERAYVNDMITYTIQASNTDTAGKWVNGTITDTLPPHVEYVANTLKIDGIAVSDDSLYISGGVLTITGITLDSGESIEISFDMKILTPAAGTVVINAAAGTGENEGGEECDPDDSPEVKTRIWPWPEVTLDKEVSAATAKVGDVLTYTITASNEEDAEKWVNGTITDVIPAGLEYVANSLTIGGIIVSDDSQYISGNTITITGIELDGDESIIITFRAKVMPALSNFYVENIATGTGEDGGGNESNPDDSPKVRTDIKVLPDITIEKSVSASQAMVGDTLTYTVTASNGSEGGTWYSGIISDEIPVGVEYIADTLQVDGSPANDADHIENGLITIQDIELQAGESVVISFQVKVLKSAAGTTVRNTATGTGSDEDGKDSDPADSNETETVIAPLPDVTIEKGVSARKANVGGILTYTVTISNAENAGKWVNGTVTDDLPDGVAFITGSLRIDDSPVGDEDDYVNDNIITVTGIELNGGESIVITFKVRVLPAAAGTTIKNTVVGIGEDEGGGDHDPKDPPETETDINPLPDVTLAKEVSAATARVGDVLTYTITAGNADNAGKWVNGMITDVIPEGVAFIEGSLKVNGYEVTDESMYFNGNTLRFTAVELQGGETLVIEFKVKVLPSAAGKTVVNAVVGTGEGEGGEGHDPKDPPETKTEIDPEPDKPSVELKKEVSTETAEVGDILTYTITVSNQAGAGVWKNGTITDELSGYVEYISGSLKLNGNVAGDESQYITGNVIEVSGIELEGGESLNIVFEVKVLESAAGKTVTNAVVGSGEDYDPEEPPETKTEIDPDPDKPSVELTKEVSAETAEVGDILTYTITVSNQAGAGVWKNGTITDELSGYVEYISGSLKLNGNVAGDESQYITGNVIEVTGIELEGGESLTVIFEVKVLESAAGKTVTNAVVGSGEDYDPEEPPETKTEIDPDPDKPSVELTKEVSAETAEVGDILTYTITVSNQAGAGVWKNGTITDELSGYVEYISGSLKLNGNVAGDESQYITGNVIEVTGIELEGGESLTVIFEVKVLESAAGKTVTNAVVGSGDDYDPEEPPETKTEIDPDPDKPSVELTKEVSAETAEVGDILTYTITVSNQAGAGVWKNGTITDELSGYVEYISGSLKLNGDVAEDESQYITGNVIEVTGIELEGGESLIIVFEVKVLESAAGKTVTNAVVGSGDDYDPEEPPETKTEIDPDPDKPSVELTKEVSAETAEVGDILTYTITVSNQAGAGVWKNGTITDELSGYVEYISGSLKLNGDAAEDESQYITGNIIEVTGIKLEGGENLTIVFEVKVLESAAGKTVTNAVVGSGDDHDPEEPPETKTEIDPDPDKPSVELTKEVSAETAEVGDILTYTITVSNQAGAGVWKNGTITDELSGYVEYISGSLKLNGDVAEDESQYITGNIIEVTGIELEGGESLIIVFEVKVLESAAGKTVTNAVVGSGDDYDPEEPPETKTEIDPDPDKPNVELKKEVSAENAKAGDILTYTITAINQKGAGVWKNGTLTDVLSDYVKFISGSLKINGTSISDESQYITGNIIEVTGIKLEGGESLIIVFEVKVLESAAGKTVTNAVVGSGDDYDPEEPPETKTEIDPDPDKPSVELKKEVSAKKAQVGDTLTYTITAINKEGAGKWLNGTITDELSDYVEYVSGSLVINETEVSDDRGYVSGNRIVVNDIELKGGESFKIVFEVIVLKGAAGNTVINVAAGTGKNEDGDKENPDDSDKTETNIDPEPDPSEPEVTLNKMVSSKKANKGDTLTYTITAFNQQGAGKWINGTIIDILPEEVIYVNGSLHIDGQQVEDNLFVKDNTITVTNIELPGGIGIEIVFQVKVLAEAEGKTITNIAAATGQNEEGGESNPQDSPKAETYINKNTIAKVSEPTTGSNRKSGTSGLPKTGDEAMLTVVLLLLAGSAILIRVSGKRKRKM